MAQRTQDDRARANWPASDNVATPASTPGVPRELGWIVLGTVALIVLHILIPIIMLIQRHAIADGVRAKNPVLTLAEIDVAVSATLIAGTIFHLLFVALYAWFIAKVRVGRNWARIALTATLVVATFASAVSFTTSPLFRLVIPVVDLLQIVLIGLLWIPSAMRTFFTPPAPRR